ncbi:hypothetical protein BC827DRAFT_327681 [Russula dissimulans]|nr:hypothetical protein BC827DRAFT_327681 [Russula dissimulans]
MCTKLGRKEYSSGQRRTCHAASDESEKRVAALARFKNPISFGSFYELGAVRFNRGLSFCVNGSDSAVHSPGVITWLLGEHFL